MISAGLFIRAAQDWRRHNGMLLAAGLAYFSLIAVVPLLLLSLLVAGWALGPAAASGDLSRVLEIYAGPSVTRTLEMFLSNAKASGFGGASVVSLLVLTWTSTQLFTQLHRALNIIWNVPAQEGITGHLRARGVAFLMSLGVGAALFFLFFANAGLDAARTLLGNLWPGLDRVPLWKAFNFLAASGVIALLSALLYKSLPGAPVPWAEARFGGMVAAALISLVTYLMGLVFVSGAIFSIYGVAAALLVILIWAFFSAGIFLYGAEVAHLLARERRGTTGA